MAILPWGDRVLGAALGLVVASGLWLVVAPVGSSSRFVTYWGVQIFLDIFMIVTSRRVASAAAAPAVSRFWGWLARAGCLFLAGDLVTVWTVWRSPGPASMGGGALHALLVGSGIATMVVVTLTHPSEFSGAQRRRVWLDATTVAAGAGAYLPRLFTRV
jgi:hypothetical protein